MMSKHTWKGSGPNPQSIDKTTDLPVERVEESLVVEVCKCGQPGVALYLCPFREEVYDDHETLCNCCEDCVAPCCEDI